MVVPTYLLFLVVLQLVQGVQLAQPAEYNCEYLVLHKELVCQCHRYAMTISSLSSLLAKHQGRVESVKLHHCQSVDLTISTVDIQQPFYQLRIEDVDQVTLHGVLLAPGHSLDLLVRNVRDHLTIRGKMNCLGCSNFPKTTSRPSAEPTLVIQVKDTTYTVFKNIDIKSVNFNLKTRNVENVRIANAQIDKISRNAIEMFYSNDVKISNSIFKHVAEDSIILNHIDRVEVTYTLGLHNKSIVLLSNLTEMTFSCTAPYEGMLGSLYSWKDEECGPLSRVLYQDQETGATVGPVILTSACIAVIIIVICVVIVLHKKGKLEQLM